MTLTTRHRRSVTGLALAAGATAAAWWLTDTAPYPYSQRLFLDLPLPGLTSARLDEVLAPRAGERILEIGPGTGLQSLHVAPQLSPGGQLDVLDVQAAMLDHVARRAAARQITTIRPALADARELPYPDGVFDAAYLITALGEIPDPERALQEIARVLTPGGRLVVGEFFDRHWIPFRHLRHLASACGLQLDTFRGASLSYLARFRPAPRPDVN